MAFYAKIAFILFYGHLRYEKHGTSMHVLMSENDQRDSSINSETTQFYINHFKNYNNIKGDGISYRN